MTMNGHDICYFCRAEETALRTDRHGCPHCTYNYPGVGWVLSTYDDYGIIFAHIYLDATETPGHWYHVRLHIRDNYTIIRDTNDFNIDLLKLPGFPINPANAKEKVKLYLLFS